MNRAPKRALLLFTILGIVVITGLVFVRARRDDAVSFQTAAVKRGDLQVTISATGTVEPEELVDVGTQVAGKIVNFGRDEAGRPVDYGSSVRAGMVLARIDDALFVADVHQAEAQLAQAQAGLQRAQAEVVQLQAKLDQATRDWNRARKLGPSEALAQSAYDAALSGYEVAKANLAVGQAAVVQSRSAVEQAKSVLGKARQNLDYCTIVSPVDGVIIDRRVNIGQTVVASLNAPSLFLIAKDLKRLQVWVAVNEADIGNIHPQQQVLFTVDAFPGETFEGRVGKVRLNATLTQNVVTYIVEVNTDNVKGRLLPYLTANARFIVQERTDVLLVPNAALRWHPAPDRVVAGIASEAADTGPQPAAAAATAGGERRRAATLWTPEGDRVRPVPVLAGWSDGAWTEVEGEALHEGLTVVLGEESKMGDGAAAQTVNPFTPKLSAPSRSSTPKRSGGAGGR